METIDYTKSHSGLDDFMKVIKVNRDKRVNATDKVANIVYYSNELANLYASKYSKIDKLYPDLKELPVDPKKEIFLNRLEAAKNEATKKMTEDLKGVQSTMAGILANLTCFKPLTLNELKKITELGEIAGKYKEAIDLDTFKELIKEIDEMGKLTAIECLRKILIINGCEALSEMLEDLPIFKSFKALKNTCIKIERFKSLKISIFEEKSLESYLMIIEFYKALEELKKFDGGIKINTKFDNENYYDDFKDKFNNLGAITV